MTRRPLSAALARTRPAAERAGRAWADREWTAALAQGLDPTTLRWCSVLREEYGLVEADDPGRRDRLASVVADAARLRWQERRQAR